MDVTQFVIVIKLFAMVPEIYKKSVVILYMQFILFAKDIVGLKRSLFSFYNIHELLRTSDLQWLMSISHWPGTALVIVLVSITFPFCVFVSYLHVYSLKIFINIT